MDLMPIGAKQKKITSELINIACTAICSSDLASAWIILKNCDENEAVGLYNKALCLFIAEKYSEALKDATTAHSKLQIIHFSNEILLDITLLDILKTMKMPKPISTFVAEQSPTLASIYATWLLSLCHMKSGNTLQAENLIKSINKYNINL